MAFLESIEFWYWWVLAGVFIILEIFSPGAFFLWVGISAALVGAVLLILPEVSWQAQLLLFALLGVAAATGWRFYQKRFPPKSDQPSLNRRGHQYVGRVFTLEAAIVNGIGKIKVDDTTWKVIGTDQDAGSQVRVTGLQGTSLTVEPAESRAAAEPEGASKA